jgi:hypothetical protein
VHWGGSFKIQKYCFDFILVLSLGTTFERKDIFEKDILIGHLTEMDTSGETSRFEKSLGLLTTRFVNLLQAADYGILDLKLVKRKTSLFDTINADFY